MLPKVKKEEQNKHSTSIVNPFLDNGNNYNDDQEQLTTSPKFPSKEQDEVDSDSEIAAESGPGPGPSSVALKLPGVIKSFAPGSNEIRMLPPAPGSGRTKSTISSQGQSLKTMRSSVGKQISQFKEQLQKEAEENEETKSPNILRPNMKQKTMGSHKIKSDIFEFDDCLKLTSPPDIKNKEKDSKK